MGILDGIRVLDVGRYVAGPYCATLLGDLGADVIRVERRGGGEDRWISPVTEDGTGATFLNLGRNKRSIGLDPRAGGEILERLIASSDVVVANLPRLGLERMGLSWEQVSRLRPDVVLTTIDAYGDVGPLADRVGFDTVGQAMSGVAHMSGPPGHPTRSNAPWVDFGTASLAAFATVAALWHRERTGEGQHVQAALLHTALAFNATVLTEEALTGIGRSSTHNRGQTFGPTDILRARDGWLAIQVLGDPIFARLVGLLGRPEWIDDPRFASDAGRGENGADLSDALAAWVADLTRGEAIDRLNDAGVPSAPVLDAAAVIADPHIRVAGMVGSVQYAGVERSGVVTSPVRLSRTPPRPPGVTPEPGADTDAILTELGFDAERIMEFRALGGI